MSTSSSTKSSHRLRVISLGVVLGLIALAAFTRHFWLPYVQNYLPKQSTTADAADAHDEHAHAEAGGGGASITLTANGLSNIGFEPYTIQYQDFEKVLRLPAIVAERPGQSRIHLTANITGIVTKIYVGEGQAVESNAPMFELRLIDEDLVVSQRDYLKTAQNLNVVQREIERLTSLGNEGVIPRSRVLEQEYEKQKLEGSMRAEAQALVLHGLNEEQVRSILETQKLIHTFVIRSPDHLHESESCAEDHLFHLQKLSVTKGQQVAMGQELGVLGDHCELYLEGQAFEDDAEVLRNAIRKGWDISADMLVSDTPQGQVHHLKLLYLADRIDPESRAFRFYLQLANKKVLDEIQPNGTRYMEWQFKPGQRMQLKIPIEKWENQIVVPIDAIVEEAAEVYVYRKAGDTFKRVSVHVLYRDQYSAVLEKNWALFPNDVIAARGAFLIHLAIKNQSGGAIDPHAGHNH